MLNKNTKTRTKLYIVLGLVLLGGLSALTVQNDWFQGAFNRFNEGSITNNTDPQFVPNFENMDAEEAAEYASDAATTTQSYAESAAEAANTAETSWTNFDATALEAAQENAAAAASSAERVADYAQSAADQALAEYERLVEETADTLESTCRMEECGEPVESDGMVVQGCTYTYDVDDPEYGYCVDALDANYLTEWVDYHAFSEDFYGYEYFVLREESELAYEYAETAQEYANIAASYAVDARSASNLAASYSLLACSGLTLSPSSYEMAADETEANFELSITVATEEMASASTGLAKNLLAFVLVELDTTVTIDGTIPAQVVDLPSSYPTQEAWQGTLVVKADGYGDFTYGTSTDNPLEIELTQAGTTTVSFAGGTEGDTIEVSIEGEESTCTSSLTITQALPETSGEVRDPDDLEETDTIGSDDVDGDGLTSDDEVNIYGTRYNDSDTDDDGTNDGVEIANGTDPLVDEGSLDIDGDGLTADEEASYGTDASLTDTDGDGLTDTEEASYGTDPNTAYTDGDGLSDYEEVITYETDPLDDDSDNDGYEDDVEVDEGTDPEDGSDYPETDENYEVPEAVSDIILSREYTCTDSFEDTEGEWHQDIICRAKEAGWVKGYSSYTFGPDGNITRAEYVKVLTKIFGLDEDDGYDGKTSFYDVSVNDWYYPYINLAEDADWIRVRDNGYYFNPNEPITRGDAILWAIRAAGQSTYDYDIEDIFSDVENSDYFAYAIFLAYETTVDTAEEDDVRVVEGYSDGTFEPYSKIARSEAMAIVTRVAIAWGVASEDWDE